MAPVNVPAKFEVRSFTRSWDNSGYLKTLSSPWIRRSRSSKVVDTNRKRVCDFLLVHHNNLGPILNRFGDIAGFLCSWVTPPLFHPNFGRVAVAPDGQCWCQSDCPSRGLKLFGREIIFEVFRPIWSRYLNVTDGRTDRRTDDILWDTV